MNNLYAHTALNLLAVLIVFMCLIYILKKIKFGKYSQNNPIKIHNTVPIGTKERVILVEVNNTFLLLGATPNHIETLYVFNELETAKAASSETFNDKLKIAEMS